MRLKLKGKFSDYRFSFRLRGEFGYWFIQER